MVPSTTAPPLGSSTALDGVRAVAVALVVLGHVDDILLPGGRDPLAGRVPRRRRLLRALRVPDHPAAARRAVRHRSDRARALLPAAGGRLLPAVAAPPRRATPSGSRWPTSGRRGRWRSTRCSSSACYVSNWAHQLRPRPGLRAWPPVVALGRGAVLPGVAVPDLGDAAPSRLALGRRSPSGSVGPSSRASSCGTAASTGS